VNQGSEIQLVFVDMELEGTYCYHDYHSRPDVFLSDLWFRAPKNSENFSIDHMIYKPLVLNLFIFLNHESFKLNSNVMEGKARWKFGTLKILIE
jgi:hypothetical protein